MSFSHKPTDSPAGPFNSWPGLSPLVPNVETMAVSFPLLPISSGHGQLGREGGSASARFASTPAQVTARHFGAMGWLSVRQGRTMNAAAVMIVRVFTP